MALVEDFIKLGGSNLKIRPKRMQEIVEFLASRYFITPKTVRNRLQKIGILHKKGTPWPNRAKIAVLNDLKNGLREKDIAKAYRGMRTSTISAWTKEYGIIPETWRRSRRLPKLDPININSASISDLMKMPMIGLDLAERIVDNRPYERFIDIYRLESIGLKRMKILRRYCYLG